MIESTPDGIFIIAVAKKTNQDIYSFYLCTTEEKGSVSLGNSLYHNYYGLVGFLIIMLQ